ncbi:MAG: diacylglycerol kinase family protein [Hyphomonadaceae bacterium]|nr:diacylglycerol kinase family protein [Hyphomonadaceae bacterium]
MLQVLDPNAPEAPHASILKPNAKALVFFNPKAGSVTAADGEKLTAALKEAGISQFALVGPEKLSPKVLQRARDFDVIIVLGGDGTARAVAELAPRDGPPLILLPGGTLNVLPRALYGDLGWPEALKAALERGVITRLASGAANGKPFFVAAIFGAPTLLARAREAVREGRFLSAWRRFNLFSKRAFARRLVARPNAQPAQTAAAIGVLCPSFSGEIEGEALEWVRLDASQLLDLARVSLRAIGNSWRDDPSIEIAQCKTGSIMSGGVIPSTLDGEPHTFFSHVRIVYDPKGPRVIALKPEQN